MFNTAHRFSKMSTRCPFSLPFVALSRKEVASLAGHTNGVLSVTFSPDGQHVVSGSDDNLMKVWSVSARKEVASLAGHTGYVFSVAFSPDGQHIVSGSLDSLVMELCCFITFRIIFNLQ